jgi:hypothetical protein
MIAALGQVSNTLSNCDLRVKSSANLSTALIFIGLFQALQVVSIEKFYRPFWLPIRNSVISSCSKYPLC